MFKWNWENNRSLKHIVSKKPSIMLSEIWRTRGRKQSTLQNTRLLTNRHLSKTCQSKSISVFPKYPSSYHLLSSYCCFFAWNLQSSSNLLPWWQHFIYSSSIAVFDIVFDLSTLAGSHFSLSLPPLSCLQHYHCKFLQFPIPLYILSLSPSLYRYNYIYKYGIY